MKSRQTGLFAARRYGHLPSCRKSAGEACRNSKRGAPPGGDAPRKPLHPYGLGLAPAAGQAASMAARMASVLVPSALAQATDWVQKAPEPTAAGIRSEASKPSPRPLPTMSAEPQTTCNYRRTTPWGSCCWTSDTRIANPVLDTLRCRQELGDRTNLGPVLEDNERVAGDLDVLLGRVNRRERHDGHVAISADRVDGRSRAAARSPIREEVRAVPERDLLHPALRRTHVAVAGVEHRVHGRLLIGIDDSLRTHRTRTCR